MIWNFLVKLFLNLFQIEIVDVIVDRAKVIIVNNSPKIIYIKSSNLSMKMHMMRGYDDSQHNLVGRAIKSNDFTALNYENGVPKHVEIETNNGNKFSSDKKQQFYYHLRNNRSLIVILTIILILFL